MNKVNLKRVKKLIVLWSFVKIRANERKKGLVFMAKLGIFLFFHRLVFM